MPALDTVPPTVCVTYSQFDGELRFQWTEPVNGFEASDITLASTPAISKGALTQDDDLDSLYRMPITLTGAGDIQRITVTIPADSVTDNAGNANAESVTILDAATPDTTVTAPSGTTLLWSVNETFGNLSWLNTAINRTPAGGGFMGVSDLMKVGDRIYGVAQVMHRRDADAT